MRRRIDGGTERANGGRGRDGERERGEGGG